MNENSVEKQQYLSMLNSHYKSGTNNHEQHNSNPKYWDILLGELKNNKEKYEGKKALDFGCGKGRNVMNMLSLADFKKVDGIDVSENNIAYCLKEYDSNKSTFYKNNGDDLKPLNTNDYSFIMSTIVLQHICVHSIRQDLFKEIYRVLDKDGVFSFQMAFGPEIEVGHINKYYDNNYNAAGSNGANDVRISDSSQIVSDLELIGFKNITFEIHESYEDPNHPQWIYVKCSK